MATPQEQENPSTSLFREYLRINTAQPNPDLSKAVEFLRKIADDLGFKFQVFEFVAKKPVVLMTWEGTQPELSSLLLNSHMDVVPVYPEHWKYPPFEAHKDEDGNIYARGTQDMKCVGIQYVEALRHLIREKKRFPRTIHLLWDPDEEVDGSEGTKLFVASEHFKKLNVGFALDEGLCNPTDVYKVFYAERSVWWVKVTCPGEPGHGSRLPENTPGQKVKSVVDSFMKFREEQSKRLENNPKLVLGDVTSCNLTILEGGQMPNVIPAELSVTFDIRVPPTVNLEEFEKQIAGWCQQAGSDVKYEFLQKTSSTTISPVSDDSIWWKTFKGACDSMGLKIETEIQSCATDIRYVRGTGVPSYGFHAVNHTPILLHCHNEYLSEAQFLKGIDIYRQILPAMASIPKH